MWEYTVILLSAAMHRLTMRNRLTDTPLPEPSGNGLSRAYDEYFERWRGEIPVEFMRALAKNESGFNPRDTVEPAWGLCQVVETVREDYNTRHGTSFRRSDLLDPDVNVRIAADLINRIARRYREVHPATFGNASWRERRFVELVIAGWNAGYSEAAGVGYVIGRLEEQGVRGDLIDIGRVVEYAR